MSAAGGTQYPDVAVNLSGEVPWSSLWQRVILASCTSGPGWSSTCLHHCRGLRALPPLALGLTYSLQRHTATSQSRHLYSEARVVTAWRERRVNKREAAVLYGLEICRDAFLRRRYRSGRKARRDLTKGKTCGCVKGAVFIKIRRPPRRKRSTFPQKGNWHFTGGDIKM